jgi:uncharacterized protein YfaS (alpha-2-macroglobulin family)
MHGETAFLASLAPGISLDKVYSPEALLYLAHVYAKLGQVFSEARNIALQRLRNMARVSGDTAHWEHHWYDTDLTSRIAQGLAELAPNDALLPKAIQWLMLQRRGDRWFSTADTARVVLALCEYMKAAKETAPNYGLRVHVNGKLLRTLTVTPETMLGPQMEIDIPFSGLHVGSNEVRLEVIGNGNCYYSALVRQVVNTGTIGQSLGSNLRVERHYYSLNSERLDDGTMRLMPGREVERVSAGDLIRCVVTIASDSAREFMMIEEPIPAGCEVVEREDVGYDEEWDYWWTALDIRDNRIVFFARNLDGGVHEIAYTLRAEALGTMRALPSTVVNMYDPRQRATGGESILEVVR